MFTLPPTRQSDLFVHHLLIKGFNHFQLMLLSAGVVHQMRRHRLSVTIRSIQASLMNK